MRSFSFDVSIPSSLFTRVDVVDGSGGSIICVYGEMSPEQADQYAQELSKRLEIQPKDGSFVVANEFYLPAKVWTMRSYRCILVTNTILLKRPFATLFVTADMNLNQFDNATLVMK